MNKKKNNFLLKENKSNVFHGKTTAFKSQLGNEYILMNPDNFETFLNFLF